MHGRPANGLPRGPRGGSSGSGRRGQQGIRWDTCAICTDLPLGYCLAAGRMSHSRVVRRPSFVVRACIANAGYLQSRSCRTVLALLPCNAGASRKRASRKADGDDDPEYESNDAEATEQVAQDELDEQDEQQPQPKGRGRGRGRGKGAGQRGGKRGGSAGRGAKRAASGAAKGKAAKRGKGAAAAMEDDDDEDMQMAKALSLQPQPQQQQQGGGDVDMGGDSDRELRAAMRASLQEERDMAQAMEMSRRGAEVRATAVPSPNRVWW